MRIARTLHWKGERLIQSRLYHDQSPGSIPMDGNATAEASITPQWLPDSPKTGAPCGNRRTSAGGHFLRNHSLFEFVNAKRLSDLIVSLLPRVLRQCALASLGQNRSTYQFAMDRSWAFAVTARFTGPVQAPPRSPPPAQSHPAFPELHTLSRFQVCVGQVHGSFSCS